MEIALLSHTDAYDGAARATFRLLEALTASGVKATLFVDDKRTDDIRVIPRGKIAFWISAKLRRALSRILLKLDPGKKTVHYSLALTGSNWPAIINKQHFDCLHLHWCSREMLSLSDYFSFTAPVVWTLHDMWAFSGAEHYSLTDDWIRGYDTVQRNRFVGIDWNRRTWLRKKQRWQGDLQLVTPSHWLADCVRRSSLLSDWPVQVIPNAINTEVWKPVCRIEARKKLELPLSPKIICFGALGGRSDKRKGGDLFHGAIEHLPDDGNLMLMTFGGSKDPTPIREKFPVRMMGPVWEDSRLAMIYSAADVFVLPSRQDNLPNTGVEAIACGCPVVAFRVCGLPDIVDHEENGYLADPFDTEQLAKGISWVLNHPSPSVLADASRHKAVSCLSESVIAEQHIKMYRSLRQQ